MDILDTIFPVLMLAAAGYITARSRFLDDRECETLARFTFNLVIPCLLFINSANSQIPADFGADFLLAFYGAVLMAFVLSLVLGRSLFGYTAVPQSVFAMGACYSNTTIVGIPLVLQALGEEALLPLFLLIAVQNVILFTLATISAERHRLTPGALLRTVGGLLAQLLRSPLTASLIAGLAFNLLEIPLYGPLEDSITLMSTAAIPVALFVLGTSLHQFRISGQLAPAIAMTVIKTMVLPVLVYLMCFHVVTLEPLWANTALLASAMPMGISGYVFAHRYDSGQASVAAGSLISTLISLLPIALILALLL